MSLDWTPLIKAASEVRWRAYAPYSNFFVGAAILTESGRVFSGCNVENASYGLAICAERSAIVQAVSAGERAFRAIAICGPQMITPCGACRQFIKEFGIDIPILCFSAADPTDRLLTTSTSLLPTPF